MMQARWVREIGVAGAFALAVLVVGAPAPRAGPETMPSTSNSIWNLEQRVWGGIVRGLGLRDPNDPGDRLPRAVAAGGSAEPRPAAAAGQSRAAQPRLAERPRRRQAKKAADAKRKLNAGSDLSRTIDKQGAPITPDQLNRARRGARSIEPLQCTGARQRSGWAPGRAVRTRLFRRPVLECGPGASAATPTKPGPSPTSRRATS